MTHELILTSVAPELHCQDVGLGGVSPKVAGSKDTGMNLVASDVGVSPRVVQILSPWGSGLQLPSGVGDTFAAYSHLVLPGDSEHVLSRIACFVSGRVDDNGVIHRDGAVSASGVLSHHIIVDELEIVSESPAWLLALPGFHFTEWTSPPIQFVRGRPIPTLINPPPLTRRQQIARQCRWLDPQKMALTGFVDTKSETYLAAIRSPEAQSILATSPTPPCPTWEELTGDSGWGGVLAETVATGQPVVLIYKPGHNILPLFVEALALLPAYAAWKTTFCTHYKGMPDAIPCQWKGVVAGSDAVIPLVRDLQNMVLDLSVPMGKAPSGRYVDFARYGQEHSLPADADDHASILMVSDEELYNEKYAAKIDKSDASSSIISFPISLVVQIPKKPAGVLETFLRRSSRFQFYFLYGIMLTLMLFLLVLMADQAGNFGLFQKSQTEEQNGGRSDIAAPMNEPAHEIISDLDAPAEPPMHPQDDEPNIVDNTEELRKQLERFAKHRENQRKPLSDFLTHFTPPPFLRSKFPDMLDNGEIAPPEPAVFDELTLLERYSAALKLEFVPLFELPGINITTVLLQDELPEVIWEVQSSDEDNFAVPMFRFHWTAWGLKMDWQHDGLSNQYIYDTLLLSLGCLRLSIEDVQESAIEIPLFAPVQTEPVQIANLVNRDYVEELPLSSELWQRVFAYFSERGLPINVVLEIHNEPASEQRAERRTSPDSRQIQFEIPTKQQVSRPTAEGEREFIDLAIPFTVSASLESVVWKMEPLTERLREEQDEIESTISLLQERIDYLIQQVFDQVPNALEERGKLQAEKQRLTLRRQEIISFLEKLPSAHAEIRANEDLRYDYSVFLESVSGRRLLLLTHPNK